MPSISDRRRHRHARPALAAGAILSILALGTGCESTPNREDVRIDEQRIDEQRNDEILPTWKKQEKKWWEI
jgi:hypothetical protein